MPPDFEISVDGQPLPAATGQTVGAVLTAAGRRSWRTTRHRGRPRGLFCGIGICFDCLLTVDGEPNRRACLVPARAGMQVETGTESTESTESTGSTGSTGSTDDETRAADG